MKTKVVVLFTVCLQACFSTEKTHQENKIDEFSQSEYSQDTQDIIQKIIGEGGGLIRGVSFGDSISQIQDKEVLEQFEDEKNRLGYTFDTPDLETVDIQYLYDKQSLLEEVQVDIYLNDHEKSTETYEALSSYFGNRFGSAQADINETTWHNEEAQVYLKLVQTDSDHGLHIRFSPIINVSSRNEQ